MANANLFQQYLQPPRSVIDYSNDYAKADALNNQNAMQSLALQQQASATAQSLAERNALQRIAAGWNADTTPDQRAASLRNSGLPGLMSQADALDQTRAKLAESQGTAAKNTAEAGKTTQDTQIAAHQQHLQALSMVNTPEDAVQWMVQGVKEGTLKADNLPGALQTLQTKGLDGWKQGAMASGQTVQQQLEMTAAKPTEVRLGNVVKTIDMNPRSQTFGKEVVQSQPIAVSPDTMAAQAGENARSAAQRETQLTIAGMSKDGSISPNLEAEAQLIASGRAAPPTGMAATRPAAAALMARVSQINPQFDATDYLAKTKAAKDFTSGNQGNAMRSFAVAGQHLDQLGQLVDALKNGDNQTVNKVGNVISAWNGNTPVTNFDAAKDVVSKEVIKAIVGSGSGGVAERDELSKLMADAKSPQQLHGVIKQYTSLMSAQHDALLAQRRAAGLKDSTLPNYGDAVNGAGSAPTGWKYLGPAPTGGQ